MLYFHNDYNQMCHPAILSALDTYKTYQMPGYGADDICARAADLICKQCGTDDLSVHFLTGGTQTNLTVIAAALRPHQAVIAAGTAHIQVHETGAIEAVGHKILAIPTVDGKISATQIESLVCSHLNDANKEHTARPKMVYISDSTELGTIYTLEELQAISAVCRKYGLYLFVDGARLGYALTAKDNDITLSDLAKLTDVFYIGGTKVGALFGEAVVISNPEIAEDFRYLIKQRGGMLAKGWLLGLQFVALLEDGLYWKIAKQANCHADKLRDKLLELGYSFYVPGSTNQIFPILPHKLLDELSRDFTFSEECGMDDKSRAVRFCTSWATTDEDIQSLCDALTRLSQKK